MLNGSIKYKGLIESEIKEKDNKYYFTFNTSIDKNNNLKSLVYVEITNKMYLSIKDKYKTEPISLVGNVIARKTKNDIPFIYLVANNIRFLNNNSNKITIKNENNSNEENIINSQSKKTWINYFQEDEFIELELNKIHITDKEHEKGQINFNKEFVVRKPIVVRKIDEDNYSLVLGFREFVYSKILDIPKIKVLITDLSNEEFKNKYLSVKVN